MPGLKGEGQVSPVRIPLPLQFLQFSGRWHKAKGPSQRGRQVAQRRGILVKCEVQRYSGGIERQTGGLGRQLDVLGD